MKKIMLFNSIIVILMMGVSTLSLAEPIKKKQKEMLLPNDPTIKLRKPIRDPNYDLNLGLSLKRNNQAQIERWYNDGADVNALDADGRSFLYQAIYRNRFSHVKFLLLRRANVNRRNTDGTFPLEAAVQRGNLRLAEYLLERGASARGRMGKEKITYLQYLVNYRRQQFALKLIEKGAHINVRYSDQSTLLHRSIALGLTQVVEQLIKKGAWLEATYNGGITPLHEAAAKGRSGIISQLLKKDVNIDATTHKQWTPLHHAARFGHQQAVRYLLRHGASPFIRNSDGKTPAQLARLLNFDTIYLTLADHGRMFAERERGRIRKKNRKKRRLRPLKQEKVRQKIKDSAIETTHKTSITRQKTIKPEIPLGRNNSNKTLTDIEAAAKLLGTFQ